MKSIDNEAIRFYLKHISTIREWAKLETDLNHEVIQFLKSMGDDIRVTANSLSASYQVQVAETSPYYLLAKPNWQLKSNENLIVAIGLGWENKVNLIDANYYPYVGMWVNRNSPEGMRFDTFIRPQISNIVTEHKLRQDTHWPAWKLVVPPNKDFWMDLTPYRDILIESIKDMWILLHEEIDNILQSNLPQSK